MNKTFATSAKYGELRLHAGARYRVVTPFADYDCKLHSVGEEFVFLAVEVLPYDDGHTFSVRRLDGTESVIRMQWQPESQEKVLESLHEYLLPV